MTTEDIDLFEVNEAFSVVAAKFIRDLELDPGKVNVNGGAMALGHPIGATGSILIGTMLDELERRDLNTGLVIISCLERFCTIETSLRASSKASSEDLTASCSAAL